MWNLYNTIYCAIGLFNKVISQSGSAVNTWAISYDAREVAFKLGEKLDIETSDSAELVVKLAEFSPKELIAASDDLPFLKQVLFTVSYQLNVLFFY